LVTTSDLQRNGASGVENNYVAAVTHNLTANMKTPKPQKIRLIAQNPRKIKAALKSWVDATGKIDSDPLKLDEAPAWVEKAYLEVIKVIMPSKKMPGNGDLPLELLGEFIGRLQAFGKLYGGEIPMGPEQKAELERLEKLAASQPKSKERTVRGKMLVEDLQARVEATNQAIPNLIKAALDSSHEDALKFQKGLLRGDEPGTRRTDCGPGFSATHENLLGAWADVAVIFQMSECCRSASNIVPSCRGKTDWQS
jgi:hypothetical protein